MDQGTTDNLAALTSYVKFVTMNLKWMRVIIGICDFSLVTFICFWMESSILPACSFTMEG